MRTGQKIPNNIIKFALFNMSTTIGKHIKYCMYKYNIDMSDGIIHSPCDVGVELHPCLYPGMS